MILRLREHGPPLDADLSGDVAAALVRSRIVDVTPVSSGRWRLQPANKVGAVRAGDVEVIVEPKIVPHNLLFLLGYAVNPGFRPDDVEAVQHEDLLSVIAESLARHTERATQRGVLQGYITVDEALPLVRGRIRASDQMARRPGMLLPMEVTYDEFSADIPENRIVRGAIRRLLTVPRVRTDVRRRLGHLDGRFDGVTTLIPGASLPQWLPSRLNQQYLPALRLSEIVLRHLSAEIGPRGVRVASFVVDMARVFEDFLTTAMREAAASQVGRMVGQHKVDLGVDGTVPMRPDVVHMVAGQPRAVFDAKYKMERDSRGVPGPDVYQMLAYCTAMRLHRGYLVYAKGEGKPLVHRIVHTNPTVEIVQRPLDLTCSAPELLEQVNALVVDALSREGEVQPSGSLVRGKLP
ncbi:McrC family protein [Phytoactinopolyspora endophytica]|uniref:McrC family protein n=1 Tax=Phytoactinopolyspora endophytica TaxID=1642495 RepID=UPI00101D417B|nr:restriction endonuclease [Phytoactinopolyspora endophytica]